MKHEGIQFDPYADVPPDVIDAVRRGKKIEAIKAYRVATGAGLKEAKDLVDGAPNTVKEDVSKEEADTIKTTLEEQGATVELK